MLNLSDKQFRTLKEYKDETWGLHRQIYSDIVPLLAEGIKQIRGLTRDITIIAGAIASFTIPTLNTSLIQTKPLAYTALFFLFLTILYAVYHLSEIIPKEVNSLDQQLKVYSEIVIENISRINKTFEDGNINHLLEVDEEQVKNKLDTIKAEEKPDKSLDRLRTLLGISLVLIILSFFDYSFILLLIGKFGGFLMLL
ncbi:hypothetical protein HY439_01590 [Candidatus Microgenomates bacterium]|nr:hypothetical protein [Candidatus Microgenomates bacterium]